MKLRIFTFLFLAIALTAFAQQTAPTKKQLDSKLEAQIWLDRIGFSPGEIDGTIGKNTVKALNVFQEAKGIPVTSNTVDKATLDALREEGVQPITTYKITEADAKGPFAEKIPQDYMEMAKLKTLPYTSLLEALSERFHSSPAIMKKLNPKAEFAAGTEIQVPNVLPAKNTEPKKVQQVSGKKPAGTNTIVLSKEKQQLVVKDADGKTIFFAPITAGSDQYPYPLGAWKVKGVAKNPPFEYSPELFKDAKPEHKKATIPPGPNNPVGTVWIDISAPHYGLHGTPEPGKIGYSESHGCIRLTNWDVERLASLVQVGVPVIFE